MAFCAVVSLTLLTDAKPQEKAKEPAKEAVKETAKEVAPTVSEKKIDPKRVPKIVDMYPRNNSKGVDPNISQIVILFDIPMSGGFAFAQRSDQTAIDGEEGTKPFWTADKKACVMPVKLRPGKTYESMMNFKPFLGFYSADGVPAKELFYKFSTARKPISEEERQKFAKNILTPESNAPVPKSDETKTTESQESGAAKTKSTLSPEQQKKAKDAFQTMVKRSEMWLLGKTQKTQSWAYNAKISSTTDEDAEVIEHDVSYERDKGDDWTLVRGTTNSGITQILAQIADKDPSQITWTVAEFGADEIKLTFELDEPLPIEYGNGMFGQWHGYFIAKVNRGVIILDAKTMMPKTAYTEGGIGEQFSNYVKFDGDVYYPKRIQIKNTSMVFDMTFKIYEPDLWLLEKSVYTYSKKNSTEKHGSLVEISDVYVNDAPAKEWTK